MRQRIMHGPSVYCMSQLKVREHGNIFVLSPSLEIGARKGRRGKNGASGKWQAKKVWVLGVVFSVSTARYEQQYCSTDIRSEAPLP